MTKRKKVLLIVAAVLVLLAVFAAIAVYSVRQANYTFSRAVSDAERQKRLEFVSAAESWLGTEEGSNGHRQILEIYNSFPPLAQGYIVQPDDEWCATYVSAVAIQCGLTEIIPTECSCQRQIELFRQLDSWEENDSYTPLPGDIIYYCWNSLAGDNTGWANHVGIVVGTWHGYIKVIEGNNSDAVSYRYIRVNAPSIRGYAIPDYKELPAG